MTIAPRWRKVWRDLAEGGLGRSALVVAALAAGTFGIGMILTSYSVLGRTLSTMYTDTQPASAVLIGEGIGDALVDSVRRVPEVVDAEARDVVRARIRVGRDEWIPMILFVVRDFSDLRLDRFTREAGAWPPASSDEVVIERTALPVAKAAIGDRVTVKTADGPERTLRIAGSVHATGLAPAWMDHMVSGWVPWTTVMRNDPDAVLHGLRIRVAGSPFDEAHIKNVAESARRVLEANGVVVQRIDLPSPRHPHEDQMNTFRWLLGAFGALTFLLGAVLASNMIHALLIKQARQVGVMKAIGAADRQVAALYLGQVGILAAIALAIGMSLGWWAGLGYADFAATMLNATVTRRVPAAWIIVVQIVAGLGVPLAVSLIPVLNASRLSVHQALNRDYGHRPFGARRLDRALARIAWLPRPLALSLRTAFERRGRLLLTVCTLAIGGAVFIAALDVAAAWKRVIAEDYDGRHYDVNVRLARPYDVGTLRAIVDGIPGVVRSEYWPDAAATVVGADASADAPGTGVVLSGPAPDSPILRLPLVTGRWLQPGDSAVAVVNQGLMAEAGDLRVGGAIRVRVRGRESTWTLVGVVKEMGAHAGVYAPRAAMLAATGLTGEEVRSIQVVMRSHAPDAQVAGAGAIERALAQGGIGVLAVQPILAFRRAIEDHLVIIISVLVLAASLVALVGGLGLASTLALNVVERTREIGVLGAIGATPRTIAGFIVVESVLIGLMSWLAAIVIAIPATIALGNAAGQLFIRTPLEFTLSPVALAEGLALVVILAALASVYPARRASRLSVREAMAHE